MNMTVNCNLGGTASGVSGGSLTITNKSNAKNRLQSIGRSGNTKAKKKLNYNSRDISSQLMRAKKSGNAAGVLSRAKSKVSSLQRCLGTGQYDDGEVRIALAHAKRMVRCAQTKVRNLKEEEVLQRKFEKEKSSDKQQQKNEVKRRAHQKEQNLKQKMATEEIQQIQKEKAKRQEILRKRRIHRNQERGKVSEADMKYLKETMDYMHSNGQIDTTAVSIELTDTAVLMNELQQIEAQIETEVDMSQMAVEPADVSGVNVTVGEMGIGF